MGKNPNAARQKKNHHKDKDEGYDKLDELQLEAARLGCEVWEVEQYQKKEKLAAGDKVSSEDSSSDGEETKKGQFNKKPTKPQSKP